MQGLYEIMRDQMQGSKKDSEFIDNMIINESFRNNQNYVFSKKLKSRVILNYEQIKTKVNGKHVIKYDVIGKYKSVNFNDIKKENIFNKLFIIGILSITILPFVFIPEINFFIKFLSILFFALFLFIFFKSNSNGYIVVRDKEKVYYILKKMKGRIN